CTSPVPPAPETTCGIRSIPSRSIASAPCARSGSPRRVRRDTCWPPPVRSTAIPRSTRSPKRTGATSTRSVRGAGTTRPSASARPLPWHGDGRQTRSFCFVDDLVDGIYRLATDDGLAGEVFNLGNPEEVTLLELAETVAALVGGGAPDIVHRPLPQDDPTRRRPDIRKAQARLGWTPAGPPREGPGRAIAWFASRPPAEGP